MEKPVNSQEFNEDIQFEVIKEEMFDDVDEILKDNESQLNEQQQETIDISTAATTRQQIDPNDLEKFIEQVPLLTTKSVDVYPGCIEAMNEAKRRKKSYYLPFQKQFTYLPESDIKRHDSILNEWWNYCLFENKDPLASDLSGVICYLGKKLDAGASFNDLKLISSTICLIASDELTKQIYLSSFLCSELTNWLSVKSSCQNNTSNEIITLDDSDSSSDKNDCTPTTIFQQVNTDNNLIAENNSESSSTIQLKTQTDPLNLNFIDDNYLQDYHDNNDNDNNGQATPIYLIDQQQTQLIDSINDEHDSQLLYLSYVTNNEQEKHLDDSLPDSINGNELNDMNCKPQSETIDNDEHAMYVDERFVLCWHCGYLSIYINRCYHCKRKFDEHNFSTLSYKYCPKKWKKMMLSVNKYSLNKKKIGRNDSEPGERLDDHSNEEEDDIIDHYKRPIYVDGRLVICKSCNFLSMDFNRCYRCKEQIPNNSTTIKYQWSPMRCQKMIQSIADYYKDIEDNISTTKRKLSSETELMNKKIK
ncbi:hypothetical protein HCN44_007345 [Aphidius gifuensis]|uniref:Uncharacterized protein n=1 Tax=Aphidius gifuensis TaxID=684658 RepID=A0A834XPF4_APHGI|nr:uncharacterized protein LOC122857191 [Aphidius gifuensis]KAF7989035.1 hypothetical protein HCN44_007345 [Aphidius gifuensis]